MARPIDLRKTPGLNLSKPGKPIDLSKPRLERQVDDPIIPGLSPVDEYRDIFAPNEQAYASNPVEGILGSLTPYGDAMDLLEAASDLGSNLDDMGEAFGVGRPIEEIRRMREEAVANLSPDAQLQLERLDPIKRAQDLGEAIGGIRHGFGRNKDGQICWFVNPELPTGYAVCTPPKPPPTKPEPDTIPDDDGNEQLNPNIPETCDRDRYQQPYTYAVMSFGSHVVGGSSKRYKGRHPILFPTLDDQLAARIPVGWRSAGVSYYDNVPVYTFDRGSGDSYEIVSWAQGYRGFALPLSTTPAQWQAAKQAFFNTVNADLKSRVGWGLIKVELVYCPPETPQSVPQPPHQEDIMQDECCLESLELLRLIARWTGATKQKVLRLPNTILEPQADDSPYAEVYRQAFGESKDVDIDSLSDLSIYLLQQISTLTGSFPFEVDVPKKIQEASKRANEPVPAKIPVFSLSGGIQQLLNLSINTQDDESRLADLIVRSVSEAYIARQQATLSYLYLKTLFDWLNIETDDATIELPTLISFPNPDNPPDTEDELLEFVKPSKIEIKYPELKDKSKDFTDILYPVIEAAQMIRTKWGHQIPKDNQRGMTEELILNWATMLGYDGAKALIERVRKKRANPDAPPDADKEDSDDDKEWRELITQIEQGFATQGTKNPDKPYGRNPSQRPRIRTINDSQDEVR